MRERRPLTAGLAVVPQGADPEAVRSFITQEQLAHHDHDAGTAPQAAAAEVASGMLADESIPARRRRPRKTLMPVGLIPVTVRLRPEIAAALKRASLERQLQGEEVFTQQDLVELALEPWLKRDGYLA